MIKKVVFTALLITFAGNCLSAQAQLRPYPGPFPPSSQPSGQFRQQYQELLNRIQKDTGRFRKSFNRDIDRSNYDDDNRRNNNSRRYDDYNLNKNDLKQLVNDFKQDADRLRDRFKDGGQIRDDLRPFLTKAQRIDTIMQRLRLSGDSQRDWNNLRPDLDRLQRIADAFNGNGQRRPY